MFEKLLGEIQKLKYEEKRIQATDYLEIVISSDRLDPLHKVLTCHFGPPLKPEGQAPSWDTKQKAAQYGGIRHDQTMYFRKDADRCEYAFLWPWGSGTRVTVKVIQAQTQVPDPQAVPLGFFARLFRRK